MSNANRRSVTLHRRQLSERLAPYIFTARGLEPNVLLRVLGAEFHVHSTILKLHSEFFFKFLDYPERTRTVFPEPVFDYEWVTQLEDGGLGWTLVDVNSAQPNPADFYQGQIDGQVEAFRKVLCAMYNHSYTVNSPEELEMMADMADYYLAVPAFSKSLRNALARKPLDVFPYAPSLVLVAWKIKHADLFRDCIIYLAGQCPLDNVFIKTLHPEILTIVRLARGSVTERLAETQHKLMLRTRDQLFYAAFEPYAANNGLPMPEYYDKLLHMPNWYVQELVREDLKNIMENKLVFGRNDFRAGQGQFKNHFLCATIRDEDLPWNVTKTDS